MLGTMQQKSKNRRSLAEILQSTSETLFPADLGKKPVDLLSRDTDGDSPLHVLVWRGDDRGIDVLIEAGIDVNTVGDMGETPLHVAIRQKNSRAAAALIRAGARTDIRSEFGATAKELLLASEPILKKLLALLHRF